MTRHEGATNSASPSGPNFFVVGAPRSGTTSLHRYLGEHPEVFMSPKKEPNYFVFYGQQPDARGPVRWVNDEAVFRRADYDALFRGSGAARAVGEVSPRYLSHPECAARIRRDIPDARIIAILRQPADRAHASFVGLRRDGWEPCADFASAVRDQPRRRAEGWDSGCLLDRGLYCEKLARYFAIFDRKMVHIALYDDLQSDAHALLRELFTFLEVDPDFEPDLKTIHNPSGLIRSRWLGAAWRSSYRLRREARRVLPLTARDAAYKWIQKSSQKPALDPDLRAEVTAYFHEDILELQRLIDRDLSHWIC